LSGKIVVTEVQLICVVLVAGIVAKASAAASTTSLLSNRSSSVSAALLSWPVASERAPAGPMSLLRSSRAPASRVRAYPDDSSVTDGGRDTVDVAMSRQTKLRPDVGSARV
jgi:hypothetical protein